MGLIEIVLVLIVLGVLAAIFIKPKALTEAEKRERARRQVLERDKREAEKKIRLENEAKTKEEAKLKAEVKALEEKSKIGTVVNEAEVICDLVETKEQEVTENIELSLEEEKKPLNEIIKGKIRKSRPITMNEQPTFQRLKEALEPEFIVLAQVSFSAILWTRYNSIRNRFNRKIVDFVICDKGFNVIAVVELDDASHKGNEKKDVDRDLLLNEARIPVIRYKKTPDISQVKSDFKTLRK